MARQQRVAETSMIVSANATSIAQFRFVSPDSSGNSEDVIYPAGASTLVLGVCQDVGQAPAAGGTIAQVNTPGQEISVRYLGLSKVEAGAAVSINTAVSSDSSGRAVSATAAAATSTYIHGIAMEAAGAAGDLITVMLFLNASQIVNA